MKRYHHPIGRRIRAATVFLSAFALTVTIAGAAPASASGRLLTAPAMQAHNTFAAPDAVKPVPLEGVRLSGGTLTLTLPAKSVAVIELR
jgi:alpha-N-arabinofuranosidase